MNQSLTLVFLVAAGIGLVVQNTLMVRITQTSSTILIAMLLNSLVGIVLFVSILLIKNGVAGFSELVHTVRWWTLIPGLLGSFFVFASISGYQYVGAATTIAVLVASQLIGGLVMDVVRSQGIPPAGIIRTGLRRSYAGDWRLAGGKTPVLIQRIVPPWVKCSWRASISSLWCLP
jgi:transporter family-2 protein